MFKKARKEKESKEKKPLLQRRWVQVLLVLIVISTILDILSGDKDNLEDLQRSTQKTEHLKEKSMEEKETIAEEKLLNKEETQKNSSTEKKNDNIIVTNSKDNEENNLDTQHIKELKVKNLPTKDELLKKFEEFETIEGSIEKFNIEIKIPDVEFDEKMIIVKVDVISTDPHNAYVYASNTLGRITDYLLDFGIWETYVIDFEEVGSITLHDYQKTTSPNGSYFDDIKTEYDEKLSKMYGIK